MQEIDTQFGTVSIVNEPAYSFNSKDNVRKYGLELLLTRGQPISVHGIALNATGIIVVGADGGCSSVHDRSALVLNDRLYLAVGDHAACLSLSSPHGLVWSTRVDMATCFGLYWESSRGFLISHGELEISRHSLEGDLVSQASGADVFSEDFRLLPGYTEAVDFNRSVYRLDYVTGEVIASISG